MMSNQLIIFPMAQPRVHLPEVLFEFVVQGRYVKVIAVDPKSGTEVSIVGDRRATKTKLQNLAVQKLKYVLGKKTPSAPASGTNELLA